MGMTINADTLRHIQAAITLVSDGARQIQALAEQQEGPSLALDTIKDECHEILVDLINYFRAQGLDIAFQADIGWQVSKPQSGRRLPWQS